MTELKYPIKYAIMKVEEQIGWYPGLHELEREYGTVFNIVSKCYCVQSHTEYLSDGNTKTTHHVVFPYNIYKQEWTHPEYSLYNHCINATPVDKLFDSFDEALIEANKQNKEILNKQMGVLPYNEKFSENLANLKEQHQEREERYKKFETMIEEETTNLKVSKNQNTTLENLLVKISQNNILSKLNDVLTPEEKEFFATLAKNTQENNSSSLKPHVKVKNNIN